MAATAATPVISTPLLRLSTPILRNSIEIDGVNYELRALAELSIFDYERLVLFGQRMDVIESDPERTPEMEAEYDGILRKIARQVLIAPNTVHESLAPGHRLSVVRTFTGLSLPTRHASAARATNPPSRSIGSPSARASRGSTAARQKRGSRKRQ